jgi:predicted transcriptional regulator of viral defense system
MLLTSVGVADRIAAGLRERCWYKRIVYLTDTLDIDLEGRENLVEAFTTGSSKPDSTLDDEGTHSSEYRLTLSVTEDTIRKAVSRDM